VLHATDGVLFIKLAIAIVIEPVTDLLDAWVDGHHELVTVTTLEKPRWVGLLTKAGPQAESVPIAVAILVVGCAIEGVFVGLPIAVIVDPVANLTGRFGR